MQRLGDLTNGRRTTADRLRKGTVTPTLSDATAGDLSLVFPYRHLVSIMEMLQALDKVAPGVYSRNTLLYGVEAKFYSNRLELSSSLETKVANLFAAGDGAGVTRGLVQASASDLCGGPRDLSRAGCSDRPHGEGRSSSGGAGKPGAGGASVGLRGRDRGGRRRSYRRGRGGRAVVLWSLHRPRLRELQVADSDSDAHVAR